MDKPVSRNSHIKKIHEKKFDSTDFFLNLIPKVSICHIQFKINAHVEVKKFLLQLKHDIDKLESNCVFLNNCGRKIIPATLTRELIKARKKSGVSNAGMHIARHTLLTNMSALNQSGAIIQKLAGHSSLTTSQKYLHHNDDQLRKALELTDSEMKFTTTDSQTNTESVGH